MCVWKSFVYPDYTTTWFWGILFVNVQIATGSARKLPMAQWSRFCHFLASVLPSSQFGGCPKNPIKVPFSALSWFHLFRRFIDIGPLSRTPWNQIAATCSSCVAAACTTYSPAPVAVISSRPVDVQGFTLQNLEPIATKGVNSRRQRWCLPVSIGPKSSCHWVGWRQNFDFNDSPVFLHGFSTSTYWATPLKQQFHSLWNTKNLVNSSGWWFESFFVPYIRNVIIPTDFHIVQRGRYTTNQATVNTTIAGISGPSRGQTPSGQVGMVRPEIAILGWMITYR